MNDPELPVEQSLNLISSSGPAMGLVSRTTAAKVSLRWAVSLVAICAFLAVGFGGMQWLMHTGPAPHIVERARPSLLVSAVTIQPRDVIEPIVGYGTARADRTTAVTARVAGDIVYVAESLELGSAVSEGDELLRIDAREYEAQVARLTAAIAADDSEIRQLAIETQNLGRMIDAAQSELGVAEREYQRLKGLIEGGTSTPREIDQARGAFEMARRSVIGFESQLELMPEREKSLTADRDARRAELEIARLNLERCKVTAPFAGRIEEVSVERGATVLPGQPLFRIVAMDRIEVPIDMPQSMQGRLAVGATARLQLETDEGVRWSGKVARLSASADVNTRTLAAYLLVENARQKQPLLPGTFVRAVIDGPTIRQALIAPRAAVQRGAVFVYREGVAQRVPVKIERTLIDDCVVTGIAAGDVVITSNLDALYDGCAIRIRSDEAPSSSASAPAPNGRVQ